MEILLQPIGGKDMRNDLTITKGQKEFIRKLYDKYSPRNGFTFEELDNLKDLYTKAFVALNQYAIKGDSDLENKKVWLETSKTIGELKKKYRERYYDLMVDVYDSQCCWTRDEVESFAYLETKDWDV